MFGRVFPVSDFWLLSSCGAINVREADKHFQCFTHYSAWEGMKKCANHVIRIHLNAHTIPDLARGRILILRIM